ncbi:recombinase family protein [Clostridium perfringens]|uniref:recombinase family protein n=1 Tax=Clostridium perfringens TaxID=1502 RepID=UPI000D70ABFB|nr:recombinase family protein [Clostridium perfringens]MBO3320260.1 recombinase family protein [Clostridium perfringens]MDK0577615.1 recombinase family protein [Clostridium perfringens]MDK0580558.1 recombinase family protein [Clostridium perfringens]MDK0667751.1 recombinase family protein [Clostridium perfringens]PWX20489.1 hypothetical protein CYK62_11105 [Clostridium perfringens]
MKRVAKFIRTSTLDQHTSIDNQSEILDNWIAQNNCILYKTYNDEGISGTKKKFRVQWLQMLEDAKNKEFDILICKSYSRFGRNQIETLQAIKELRENKIRIVFLEDGLDSMIDDSRFGLMAWLSEEESKRTSKRIKGVFSHFKEVGKIYNCIAPFGYDYDINKKNFVINKDESEVVKRVFRLYLLGNGTNKIANILESEGVPTKNGGKWRGNTIKNMIRNEVYLGTLVQNKSSNIEVTNSKRNFHNEDEYIKHLNNHEAIVNEETFIKANEIFKKNSDKVKNRSVGVRASNTSLFSNLLRCGSCNSSMSIRRKSKRKPFYNCIEYERLGLKCGHNSNFIQEEFLIEYIEQKLNELIENNFENIKIIEKNDIKKTLENDLKNIQKKIDEQINLANNLLKLYNNKMINDIQFKLQNESISNMLNSLIENKKIIEEKINNLPKKNNEFKKDVNNVVSLPIAQWSNAMLKKIIDKITVGVDGTIKIDWKINKM